MNTTQKSLYRKITLTIPERVATDLQHMIPKGERSTFTAETLDEKLKLLKFRAALKKFQEGPPITIKLHRGGWRKPISLSKKR